jgi:hypothetical protein
MFVAVLTFTMTLSYMLARLFMFGIECCPPLPVQVRILTKILPDSMKFMQASAEDGGGGGNRVSEQQIKAYLKVGEAGVGQGAGTAGAESARVAAQRMLIREGSIAGWPVEGMGHAMLGSGADKGGCVR